MGVEYSVAPEAELDLAEAYDWYEDQRIGLGEDFLSCVDACFQRICRTPNGYEVVVKDYRRAILRRFPYVVFYTFSESHVTVYGIFHSAQDSEKWRRRLG